LDKIIQDVPRSKKLFIGGDFNDHIGKDSEGYDTAHGGFGYGKRNNGGVLGTLELSGGISLRRTGGILLRRTP